MIKNLYAGFEPVLTEYGIGTVSEVYDGDPPPYPRELFLMLTVSQNFYE